MCNPVSLLMHPDRTVTPPRDAWNHSHDAMARAAGLTNLQADRWAKVEVRPPGDVFRDPATREVLRVTDSWEVVVDEVRAPAWWAEDRPAQEARARAAAAKWLEAFPPHLVPGHFGAGGDGSTLTGGDGSTLTGGDDSTLTGGHDSTLTGGDRSTLTGGDYATLTGGYGSTLTGGYGSTLTGGDGSTLTGGDYATLTGGDYATLTGGDGSTLTGGHYAALVWKIWDGTRYRLHVAYVGEGGIRPNTPYVFRDGAVAEAK